MVIARKNELDIDVRRIRSEIDNMGDEFLRYQQMIAKNVDLKEKMKEVKIMEYISKAKEHMTKLSLE